MATKKATATAKTATRRAKAKAPSVSYDVTLRTREMHITAKVEDRILYPNAVMWNRLLAADQGRNADEEADRRAWHQTGHKAILDLAKAGGVTSRQVDAFIASAAKCGEVQVEMQWLSEDVGWAARVFPWEALIALGTKHQREQFDSANKGMVVVRMLRPKSAPPKSATGPVCFAVSAGAKKQGFDTTTERAAIEAALGGQPLQDLPADTLPQLARAIDKVKPRILHYVLDSAEELEGVRTDGDEAPKLKLEAVARAVATHDPELVAFSTCHSGRRLAPLAIAHGARLAVGFHGQVMDSSIPVFFGAFYREWEKSRDAIAAVREGLAANHWQKRPDELGVVTIWSAVDLLLPKTRKATLESTNALPTEDGGVVAPEHIAKALLVTCTLEQALNYSMLHNRRGGFFARFDVLKTAPGRMDNLEVTMKIDTGLERPAECHFFAALPEAADRTVDFVEHVTVPLGSELMRRRGEMLRGTVEIAIRCGQVQVFHRFDSIELPPCDEWKDDDSGRRFLPSFIFPRDPAVREILTAAQPFIRALTDNSKAGFDGYGGAFATTPDEGVRLQLRAIWAALQHTWRIDYSNPPPSYTRGVQRVRTPEEILRSRRATCIELALLLASCWEHIGILPVLFLTPGHAFAGYWTSEEAWKKFFDTKALIDRTKNLNPSNEGLDDPALAATKDFDPVKASGGGTTKKDEGWVLKAPHHLAMIHREVAAGRLVPVEATYLAVLESFSAAEAQGRAALDEVRDTRDFDGMIDTQTARDLGVTPLAIITQGTAA